MVKKELGKYKNGILALAIITFAFAVAGVISLIQGLSYNEIALIVIGGIFALVGVYGFMCAICRLIEVAFLNKLATIIEDKRKTNIKELSEIVGKSEQKVDKAMMKLFKGDFVSGFYYDHNEIEKVADRNARLSEKERLVDATKAKEIEKMQEQLAANISQEKLHSVRCQSCGANVIFKGRDTICPYCGNLIVSKSASIIK